MIDINTTKAIFGSNLQSDGMLAGLDLMTSIQVLLVQDYDNQLKHMGKQIKTANKIKKAYRKNIEANQKLLSGDTVDGDKSNAKVKISQHDYQNIYLKTYEHKPNSDYTGIATVEKPFIDPKTETKPNDEAKRDDKGNVYYEIEKSKIETKVSNMNLELDNLNEQSELMSLKLQSLTNQRKTAFETVSNLVRKEADTMATMVRNLAG